MENKEIIKEAEKIANTIFYSPATNGQADASIANGVKLIEYYGLMCAQKQDAIQAYFNEITGVENGKLTTQWVKGFKVKSTYYQNAWAINSYENDYFLYPDKTKVTNKVIQSY